jgi:hypothetical protein
MVDFILFINVFLSAIGVALMAHLLTDGKDTIPLRLTFIGYFLVVLQYNFDRVLLYPNSLMIAAAAASLLLWTVRRIPATEV